MVIGQQRRERWIAGLGVGTLTILAFGLRAWKADWALPYVPHPDEPAIMNTVLRMLRDRDLNPHFFYYPSLWIYVQAAVGWLQLRWGIARGIYASATQLPATTDIATSVPGFFVWGRLATAITGAATIPVVYALARRLAGSLAGLIAAALLTVNTFHIINSHYVMTDVPSAFLTSLALLWAVRIADRGSWRDYIVAGLFTGLAAGAKHHAVLVAVAIVVAHGVRWRGRSVHMLPRLIVAGVVSLICFLLTSPFVVLDYSEFRRDLTRQLNDYAAGAHGDITGAWPIRYYLDFYRERALGTFAGLLALWGTIALLRRRDWRVFVLWALVLAMLGVFLPQGNHWMRNLLPTQAPLFALAGAGAADLLHRLQRGTPRFVLVPLGAALLAILLLPSTSEALQYERQLARGDSRTQALGWIEANVPPGVQIAAELKPVPGVGEPRWTEVEYLPQHDLAWYRRQGYAYVIASSDTWRQLTLPEAYARFAGGSPVVEFNGAAAGMFGPRLLIYRTNLTGSDVTDRARGQVQIGGVRFLGATIGAPDADDPRLGVQPTRAFKPGTMLGLRTFWQVDQPLKADYFLFVHLLDANGKTVAQRDTPPWQGRFPTSSWQAGTIVVDVNDLALPALPPDEYQVVVGLFDPATGTAPPVRIDGQPQGSNAVPLTTITIAP